MRHPEGFQRGSFFDSHDLFPPLSPPGLHVGHALTTQEAHRVLSVELVLVVHYET